MDLSTRICYDCIWKCGNCIDDTDCYDSCRGDRVFDDGSGSGNIYCLIIVFVLKIIILINFCNYLIFLKFKKYFFYW